MRNKIIKHICALVCISVLIFLIGLSVSKIFVKKEEEKIRNDLLSRVQTISKTIDAQKFENITSTPEDNTNPNYQILRSKLIETGKVNEEFGVRWIYTLIPRDGQIVFSVDSITDSNHSEPGDIYVDVKKDFFDAVNRAWDDGQSTIIEPYTDQWGNFISIIAPIRNLETNAIVSVIGIDIDYVNFYLKKLEQVEKNILTTTILIIASFVFIYLYILYIQVQRKKTDIEKIRLQYALEGANDGFWDWNLKTNKVYFSPRWKEMIGFNDDEIKNNFSEWEKRVHPDDLERAKKLINEHVQGTTLFYENVHRLLCKDGKYAWILSRGKIVSYDTEGKAERMVGTHTDLTEFKKIELELSQKVSDIEKIRTATLNILEDVAEEKDKFLKISNRLKLATESGKIGILELDLKENKIYGDKITCSIYGGPDGCMNGIPFDEWKKFVHQDDIKKLLKGVQNAIKKDSIFSMVFRIKLLNGTEKYIQSSASVEKDKDQNPIRFVGVNIDITREFEIDKAKTEFVSLASHQLKTPVGAMSWNLEMLLDGDYGELTKQQKNVISEVYDMNKRMSELVNSFLNMSRIELGTFVIEPKIIDYTEVCENVLKELEGRIQEKKHTIERQYQELIPQIEADPKLLHIIFQNLLSNAVKYTQNEGKIEVFIGVEKNKILIKVHNNGKAIPLSDQSKIFDRMFRASDAQIMDPNGNGLGLYLLKSIVENGGGKTWFESTDKKGTTFYVAFPMPGMKAKTGNKKII